MLLNVIINGSITNITLANFMNNPKIEIDIAEVLKETQTRTTGNLKRANSVKNR